MRNSIEPGSVILGVSVAVVATLFLIAVVWLVGSQTNRAGALGGNVRPQHVLSK